MVQAHPAQRNSSFSDLEIERRLTAGLNEKILLMDPILLKTQPISKARSDLKQNSNLLKMTLLLLILN